MWISMCVEEILETIVLEIVSVCWGQSDSVEGNISILDSNWWNVDLCGDLYFNCDGGYTNLHCDKME